MRTRQSTWQRLAVAGAVLAVVAAGSLAVLLRFRASSPLWLDEAQSVAIARLPLGQLFDALRADGAPPLYYLLLHGWMAVFGSGDVAVRALSALFSLLALGLLWVAGSRLGTVGPRASVGGPAGNSRLASLLPPVRFPRALAIAAVAVGATNPWMIRYAGEARMYALVVVLSLLAFLAFDNTLRRGRHRDVLALGLATAALLLTHYWAMFLLAAAGVGMIATLMVAPRLRRSGVRVLAGMSLGGLLFLPWVPSFLYQVGHTGAPWADRPGLGRLAVLPVDWAGGEVPGGRWLLLVFLPLLVLGALAAPHRQGREVPERISFGATPGRWLAGITVLTLLLAVVATRLTNSGIEPRYTAVVVPFVLLLVALGALTLPRPAAAGALGALVGLGLLASSDVVAIPRTQAGDVAAALEAYAGPQDVVVYCPDQLAPAVSRLLPTATAQRVTSLTVPQSPPERVDWIDYERRIEEISPARLAAEATARADGGAVWTLTSPRYRTHQGLCGGMRAELGVRGLRPHTVVGLDPRSYEFGVLERWVPRSPWEAATARFALLGRPLAIDR